MTQFEIPQAPRLLLEADLSPLQGRRFQPTGFPDIGPGVYTLPDGTEHLLVESSQSVANRLEAACWDEAQNDLVAELKGLPYVRVVDVEGRPLTTSMQEAHRLNSPYIEKSDFFERDLKSAIAFDEKKPLDREKLIRALARFDLGCLVHGVFLESIAGVLRISRALSGFIEAEGVTRIQSGGVKNDRVQATKDEEGGRTAAEGFGNVPFHRTEFTAQKITAYFNLDLEQLRGYRLGKEAEQLLFALSLFKIQRFLSSGLRLRTACDLAVHELRVTAPSGYSIPTAADLSSDLPRLIESNKKLWASPAVTTATFKPAAKKAKGS